MIASFTALAAPTARADAPGLGLSSEPASVQATRTIRLENGLTILVVQDKRFPLVSLRLYVHAGSAFEEPFEAGISHFLEHMVFKGTERRPKGQVAADIEQTGGYLNAATSFDYTVYLTDMTRDHWKTGMDVLRDMAFNPTLDPEELLSERDVILAELKRGEDNPGQRLFRMTQQAALRGTPYANPIIGFEETIRNINSDMMRDYIARFYQPQSMLLLICGDVEPDEAIAEAKRLFGDLENTRPIVPPSNLERDVQSKGFTATVEKGPWNKVHLALALPAPALADVRAAQLDVLAQVLGGDATSRFYRTYKYDKRLVDSISIGNFSFERLGLIYIHAVMDAEKLVPFWESFSADLSRLAQTTFSEEELNRAKLNLEDDLFRSKETLGGLTSKIGYFAFLGGGELAEENYLRLIRDANQAILLDLIASFFAPERLSMSVLLPESAVLAELLHTEPARAPAQEKDEQAGGTEAWENWLAGVLANNWPAQAMEQHATTRAGRAGGKGAAGQVESIDLGNGRTLVLIPDTTLPYTAMNLIFTGGDTLLSEKDQGLAAFTASLLTKGTTNRSATGIEDYLSDRAASMAAAAGRQTFSLSTNAPARFTGDMFALLDETLRSAAFKDEEAERVRVSQISAITMREDQPTGLAFRRIFPFLFRNHPYGFLQLGEKDRVARFTVGEAREFWKKQIGQPWVLAVCGAFDREAILAAAQKLPLPAEKGVRPGPPDWSDERLLRLTLPSRNQSHLFMLFPTVGFGHKDEPGLNLMQNILAGQSGLLFRDLRDEQGLAYTVTAIPWRAEEAGAIIFYIGTEPGKMQQAEEGFRRVIADLWENKLPEEDLERGKNRMQGDYFRAHQSLASRSAEAATLTVLGRPLDATRTLIEQARSVDARALRELARTYLDPDRAYIVKVEP